MKTCWKTHEPTFQGHENKKDFRFHGVDISNEISMKFLAGYLCEPFTVNKTMNMDFQGSWNL